MANELVRINYPTLPEEPPVPVADEHGEAWDLPPELDPSLRQYAAPHLDGQKQTARQKRINTNSQAEQDVSEANERGDFGFAALRETDAAEHKQARYDWGDARTWMWISAMFFGFLILVCLVYYMPYGRHNQADGGNQGGHPTPTIRVY